MAPKAGMTQAQKLEKILNYFHDSATCHTLKDLETNIPAATKIHKMQIKELIKELTDTNQVKVEKIGSGNWYWAWAGEQLAEKTDALAKLESEQVVLDASVLSLQSRLTSTRKAQAKTLDDLQYQQLCNNLEDLEKEVKALAEERDQWEHAVAGGVDSMQGEMEKYKAQAIEATDNLYALEDHLRKTMHIDHQDMIGLRLEYYGKLCADGEMIPELDET